MRDNEIACSVQSTLSRARHDRRCGGDTFSCKVSIQGDSSPREAKENALVERNTAFDDLSCMVVAAKTEEPQQQGSEAKPSAEPPPSSAQFDKLLGDSGMDLDDGSEQLRQKLSASHKPLELENFFFEESDAYDPEVLVLAGKQGSSEESGESGGLNRATN